MRDLLRVNLLWERHEETHHGINLMRRPAKGRDTLTGDPQWWEMTESMSTVWETLSEGEPTVGETHYGETHHGIDLMRRRPAKGRDPQWWEPTESISTVWETLSEGRDPPWREPPEQESTVRETHSVLRDPLRADPPGVRLAEGRDALRTTHNGGNTLRGRHFLRGETC